MGELWVFHVLCLLAFTVSLTASEDHRNEVFDQKQMVELMCTNKTWEKIFYTIWKITKRNRPECTVGTAPDKVKVNTCEDGKQLQTTASGVPLLHIPQFQYSDEGIYKCEVVYDGGEHTVEINISARVPPQVTARFVRAHMVAVCKAANSKPPANVSWSGLRNWTQNTIMNPNGTYTVESLATVPDNTSIENVTCIVAHPLWEKPISYTPEEENSSPFTFIMWVIIAVGLVSFIIIILGASYIIRKYVSKIRNCCKSNIATPPTTTTKIQDVDELEPYASYVERVNSIYNSSAELCNA
ncbi:cell surface glycoprotein CD200 receptor 1 isoform X2 [Amia ocellicauda]|uniref:cell surface glycoprotein CD200 receptor 1 isoform X2 n=1 Tax=Amia ocellicauda TaxID=2972642 RepID=UPI0034641D39